MEQYLVAVASLPAGVFQPYSGVKTSILILDKSLARHSAWRDRQLLGCVAMDDLTVTAGVDAYPRLGDRIYAAPHRFIALLPQSDGEGDG